MKFCKIAFCIDSLDAGGAERQFIELVRGLDKKLFSVHVILFDRKGEFFPYLETVKNIQIHCLKRKPFCALPVFLVRLYRLLKTIKPDIIHGYLGGTNEICLFMGKLLKCRVVWGIRASKMNFKHYPFQAKIIFKAGAWLSRFPDMIIVNSHAGKLFHQNSSYYDKRMVVIHNGIDHNVFYPNPYGRKVFRKKWGIDKNVIAIGLVARIDPMKGHKIFLDAAARLNEKFSQQLFLCIGGYADKAFYSEIVSYRSVSESNILFTGSVSDISQVYNALDICVSSSLGEGFSNTIAESMACGTPCVVSDVGDSSCIVGDTGLVVPPNSPDALADAIEAMVLWTESERRFYGIRARQRIIAHFSIQNLVNKTSCVLESLI